MQALLCPIILYSCIYTSPQLYLFFFFFFNDTATTEIYTLSLHDALPISFVGVYWALYGAGFGVGFAALILAHEMGHYKRDRKSTRLNSSHGYISYAVFCLKKKKKSQV